MSGWEIERKFLVKDGDTYKNIAISCSHIRQGYIPADGATVRVRVRDDKAYLTIKGKASLNSLTRYEFEHEISSEEASQLLQLCKGGFVDKHRWIVPMGQHRFEVDEFHGENEGLVIAEIEFSDEKEAFERPSFIGEEVTQNPRFRNTYILSHPFKDWEYEISEGCLKKK